GGKSSAGGGRGRRLKKTSVRVCSSRGNASRRCAAAGCSPANLSRRVDANGFQEPQVLDFDSKGRSLRRGGSFVLTGVGCRHGTPAAPRFAAVDPYLRVENHVEVVAFFADPLNRVVHSTRAGDRFVDRLAEILQHLAKMIVQFHCPGRLSLPLS